jgi:hypothetical protein
MEPTASSTGRQVVLRAAAITSVLAAVIHFAVAGPHFQEYWLFGVFMLVVAWSQLAWAAVVLVWPSKVSLGLGAVLNIGVVAVYVVTRTVGDVIGPTPHEVEPVGFGDVLCTACEALVVASALLLIARPLGRAIPRLRAAGLVATAAGAAAVLLSVALVDGGPEMVMSMSSDAAASAPTASLSLTTASPAGPVTMPEPDLQMAPGMKMAAASCTKAPTRAQESATVDLVNTSWADDQKYRSLAVAKEAGFRPITPTVRPVVHYISPANYKATLRGGPVINPAAPQSLVYANTPAGAVLVAAMYIQSPLVSTAADPGGCLTQWHVHTNLCFGRGGKGVVGEASPTCPAGSVNRISPPMLHVWFVPIPGGPTAVDATDAQVVQAAERQPAAHNGTA